MLFASAVIAMFAVWALLFAAAAAAPKLGLIDSPENSRKLHTTPTPLAGGLAVIPVVMVLAYVYLPDTGEALALIAAVSLIFVMGLIDDSRELPASLRFCVQIAAAAIVVHWGGANILQLGDLVGLGNIELGTIGGPIFTGVCIVAAINAFNMIDGVDGLLGSVTVVILAAAAALFSVHGNAAYAGFCVLAAAALLPYIDRNISDSRAKNKVFMGDAGSMALGLIVVFVVIKGATTEAAYQPVIALFLVAIPIFDMLRVFSSRLRRGVSPFHAEANHMHHVLWHTGKENTVRLIVASTALVAAAGTLLAGLGAAESTCFAAFLGAVALLASKVQWAHRSNPDTANVAPTNITALQATPIPATVEAPQNQDSGSAAA